MVIREWEGGVISIVDIILQTQLCTLKIAAALKRCLGKELVYEHCTQVHLYGHPKTRALKILIGHQTVYIKML